MDIHKIISDALIQSAKDISDRKFSSLPEIDDKSLAPQAEANYLLMNYSNILLSTYHEELKKSLADQGISI